MNEYISYGLQIIPKSPGKYIGHFGIEIRTDVRFVSRKVILTAANLLLTNH